MNQEVKVPRSGGGVGKADRPGAEGGVLWEMPKLLFFTRLPSFAPDTGQVGEGARFPGPERTKQRVVGERVTSSGFQAAPPGRLAAPAHPACPGAPRRQSRHDP